MAVETTVQSGIYAITNTVNGKIYIGSTVDFKRRWHRHRSGLRRGDHCNRHLQRAWSLCGEAIFEFGVLEYLDRLEELSLAEQWWMDVYRLEGKELYNHGLFARSPNLGTHPSEESKRKMSEAAKGNQHFLGHKHTEAIRCRIREAQAELYPAFVHRRSGEIIPAGTNLAAMCRERGLDQGNMANVKLGKIRSCKGWVLQSEHFQPWLL